MQLGHFLPGTYKQFEISNQYKVYKDLQRYRPDQTIIFVGGIGMK